MKDSPEIKDLACEFINVIPEDADANRVGDALIWLLCLIGKSANVPKEIMREQFGKAFDMYWDLINIDEN